MKLIRSADLASTVPYAYAAVSGTQVFAAGACPLDASGAIVSPGDVAAQMHRVMQNLSTALEASGSSLANIVRTTVYVATDEQPDLVAAWEVYQSYLQPHDPPSTLLGVSVLGYPGQVVEVEAIAELAEPRSAQQ